MPKGVVLAQYDPGFRIDAEKLLLFQELKRFWWRGTGRSVPKEVILAQYCPDFRMNSAKLLLFRQFEGITGVCSRRRQAHQHDPWAPSEWIFWRPVAKKNVVFGLSQDLFAALIL